MNIVVKHEPIAVIIRLIVRLVFEPFIGYNRLMKYNWQQSAWPRFKYDLSKVEDIIISFAEKAGLTRGLLNGLPEDVQKETIVDLMVSEALKTSAIEGEFLDREDVSSSIKKNLGLTPDKKQISDERAKGISSLMLDVRESYNKKLTKTKLFSWHRMIMQGSKGYKVGAWRTGKEPMQVVSGAYGKEKVHFIAPPSEKVPKEMTTFIKWFNDTDRNGNKTIKSTVIRSAIAHLYFETIHPLEDGNGRMGRAISDKALLQGFDGQILLSLSKTIEENKKDYYNAIKQAQRSNEITQWLVYFSELALQAQTDAEREIKFTLRKTKFFDQYGSVLNTRQLKVIKRMLQEGPKGFEGGMNARKYISITNTSKATATRDLQDLVKRKIFQAKSSGGRSTSYDIKI